MVMQGCVLVDVLLTILLPTLGWIGSKELNREVGWMVTQGRLLVDVEVTHSAVPPRL